MSGFPRALSGLFAIVLVGGSASAAPKAPDWVVRARATVLGTELLAATPPPSAAILWRQQIITASSNARSTRFFRREAVKILTPEGTSAAVFHSSYDDDSKVDVEGAWTLHADGSAEELKLSEVVTVQLAHAEYVSDTRVVAFQPPRLSAGDVAAFSLSRKSRRDVFQWVLPLQSDIPIAAEEVLIDLPEGWSHRWRLTAAPDGYAGPLAGRGGAKASYLFGPQRASPDEELSPAMLDRIATFEVAVEPPGGGSADLVFRTWNDVGAWFHRKSLPGRGEAPRELLHAEASVTEVARWLQEKIRYVALEVGEAAYAPREPALVARRLYGDCKDKTFLAIALLARGGTEALPVLTRSREDGAIDPEFPSPVQFNHLIAAIRVPKPTGLSAEVRLADGLAVLFDPTDVWTPYGQLPASLQGARGLLVRADGAELLQFPVSESKRNRLVRRIDARISMGHHLTATVTEITDGALAGRARYQGMSPPERQDFVSRFVSRQVPSARASDLRLVNLEDREKPMEVSFSIASNSYLRRSGTLLLMPLLPFSVAPSRVAGLSERRFPLYLGVPSVRELTARFELPTGVQVDALPEPMDVDNACCRYRFRVTSGDGFLAVTETFEVKRSSVAVQEIGLWKAVDAAAAKASAAKAVLLGGS